MVKDKKDKNNPIEEVKREICLLSSEWAQTKGLDVMLYPYYDIKLGKISEEEFSKIQL